MALEMIPDRPGREVAVEPKLDGLLAIFYSDWVMPQTTAVSATFGGVLTAVGAGGFAVVPVDRRPLERQRW